MKQYYLYHYYEAEKGPFLNLSSLQQDKAETVLEKLREEGNVFASKRNKDYVQIRKSLEETARQLFIEKGGKPEKLYPHYMTLERCDWLKNWYVNGKEIKIDIEEFDPVVLSFTYGDLFPTMRYNDQKPYRKQVYTKGEILKVIEEHGLPQEWNKQGDKGPERYIEVQIWDDKVIQRYI